MVFGIVEIMDTVAQGEDVMEDTAAMEAFDKVVFAPYITYCNALNRVPGTLFNFGGQKWGLYSNLFLK